MEVKGNTNSLLGMSKEITSFDAHFLSWQTSKVLNVSFEAEKIQKHPSFHSILEKLYVLPSKYTPGLGNLIAIS